MTDPGEPDHVDLYWIPVGAGTRLQRFSLILYEAIAAFLSRRPRKQLVHAGLVGNHSGRRFTLELTPAEPGPNVRGEVVGPVALRLAGRLRLFRYQVCVLPNISLPDQQFAVLPLVRVTSSEARVGQILLMSKLVPAYTWGRRRPGHHEMWTSDSTVAWILSKAGVEAGILEVPEGSRAPGWRAGLAEASATE